MIKMKEDMNCMEDEETKSNQSDYYFSDSSAVLKANLQHCCYENYQCKTKKPHSKYINPIIFCRIQMPTNKDYDDEKNCN